MEPSKRRTEQMAASKYLNYSFRMSLLPSKYMFDVSRS